MQQYFDQVYVINRKCDLERLENIKKQFDLVGLKFKVFEATDKTDLNEQELKDSQIWAYPGNTFYCKTNPCSCSGNGHELSTGQLACAISHSRIYEDIIKNNIYKALIFEDDVILHENFVTFMNKLIDQCKQVEWHLVYFSVNNNHHQTLGNPKLYKTNFGFSGTQMYAVTFEGAQILQNNVYPIRAAADGFLDYFIIKQSKLHAYVSSINMCLNGSINKLTQSTI
jgi:glycosyl transferase family 25